MQEFGKYTRIEICEFLSRHLYDVVFSILPTHNIELTSKHVVDFNYLLNSYTQLYFYSN